MRILFRVIACAFIGILSIASCTTSSSSLQEVQPSPTWIASPEIQKTYIDARDRWQSLNVSNYAITVDVFSSRLAPPYSAKVTITVQDNKLVATHEIETPMPVQLLDGRVVYNPECHEYEDFLVTKQFEVVEKLLAGELPYQWNATFDAEYGFVTELNLFIGGESTTIVSYSDFQPK